MAFEILELVFKVVPPWICVPAAVASYFAVVYFGSSQVSNPALSHADDLMHRQLRDSEDDSGVEAVINTARQVNAMVAVITGGDPLVRVDRAVRLIQGVGPFKPLVLDTSGVPVDRADVRKIIPILQRNQVHARVSLDEFDPTNSKARPINPTYVKDGRTAYSHAEQTIKEFLQAGIPVSVQTVLSRFNDYPENLLKFATVLNQWGVRNWIIHVTVLAGKAAATERLMRANGRSQIKPKDEGMHTLRQLVRMLEQSSLPLDLRVTNANPVKYSVFLVGSKGDVYTEGLAHMGKKLIYSADDINPTIDIWKDVDEKAHTARYSNWVEGLYAKSLRDLTIKLNPN